MGWVGNRAARWGRVLGQVCWRTLAAAGGGVVGEVGWQVLAAEVLAAAGYTKHREGGVREQGCLQILAAAG